MSSIKFDVYGRHVSISRTKDGWNIDFMGGEGKKRPAADIFIPDFISESEIEQYLADLCHEWARMNIHWFGELIKPSFLIILPDIICNESTLLNLKYQQLFGEERPVY